MGAGVPSGLQNQREGLVCLLYTSAPYSALKRLEKEGVIGSVYPYLLTTTGNSTSVADATKFGQEMAQDLLDAGVNGVILTST